MGNAAYKNETDIGIKPADGISPPTLSLPSETQEPNYDQSDTHVSDTVWTSKTQTRAVSSDGLTVVYSPLTKPCSVGMAEQCQAMLTPRELSMIEIGEHSIHCMYMCIYNYKSDYRFTIFIVKHLIHLC